MRVAGWNDHHTARARQAFIDTCGPEATARRTAGIAALDAKDWHGRRVYRLTCHADFGKGPHDQFVPEGLLWALMDLSWWQCPKSPPAWVCQHCLSIFHETRHSEAP